MVSPSSLAGKTLTGLGKKLSLYPIHRLHHLLKPSGPSRLSRRTVSWTQRMELRVILAISLAGSPRLAW